jgi:NNP family nitrate/nitrite transporter-like MFS transporter
MSKLLVTETSSSNYRWYILALTMLTHASIAGAARMCMPVLFKQISDDLGLSMVAVGTIWGMDPLAGVFIGLPGGLLADRFGVKRTLTVICILAGVFGALRGLSVNFMSMAAIMFLFGFMAAATPSIVPKTTAVWFSGRLLGIANALINMALSIGAMIATMFSATVFSPWLGSWRNVLFLFGAPPIFFGLLWLVTGREADKDELPPEAVSTVPFRQALSRVVRIKEVWIVGLVALTNWGANMGLIGYLPLYLRNIGWTPASADSVVTALLGVNFIGAIPMVILSDRLRTRKWVVALSCVMMAISFGLLPIVSVATLWTLLIITTFVRSGAPALFRVMVFENKSIGATYGGTAIGLMTAIGMLGAFFAPPLGNSLADINPGLPFIFWAGLSALGFPLLFFVKEEPLKIWSQVKVE